MSQIKRDRNVSPTHQNLATHQTHSYFTKVHPVRILYG